MKEWGAGGGGTAECITEKRLRLAAVSTGVAFYEIDPMLQSEQGGTYDRHEPHVLEGFRV